jgi:hypothetical protein
MQCWDCECVSAGVCERAGRGPQWSYTWVPGGNAASALGQGACAKTQGTFCGPGVGCQLQIWQSHHRTAGVVMLALHVKMLVSNVG